MATLTPVSGSSAGVAVALQAADSGGDDFVNTQNEVLIVDNAHAALPRTVTLVSTTTVDGLAVDDQAKVVPALGRVYFSGLSRTVYNDASNKVSITYSDSGADLTVGVLKVR